ncbi:hypothetical protein [Marinagarivorans algicola]|uniref:hypothetical protein n=1 Tax=Marinagarivorans algicola TaxID=1513270 RepID=UPI0037358470
MLNRGVQLSLGIALLYAVPLTLACEQSAITPLEKLYCQVQAKGEGADLPSFNDFRRNSPQTQRLLLKRPAKRAELPLPAKTQAPNKTKASVKAPVKTQVTNTAQASVKTKALTTPKQAPVLTSLKGCRIHATGMTCRQRQYRLLDNLVNKKLASHALTPANTLQLPEVPTDLRLSELHSYLQGAYAKYLHKMNMIGLAGATLSYSKFYYIFEEVSEHNRNFVKRFADMYRYLKKDKSTIAIGRAHKNKPLPPLSSCEPIDSAPLHFIVCDVKGTNWVYQYH